MPSSPGAAARPPTVVVFAASPRSLTPLDLEGELRAIEAELEHVGLGGVLQLVSRPAATPDDLQRVLLRERPAVVQFSGHGRGRAAGPERRSTRPARELKPHLPSEDGPTGIMLQGSGGRDVAVVSGAALGALFAATEQRIRLVFLNACHSAEQATALLEHVEFVVGVDGAIADEAAKAFAVAFYRALAYGRSIGAAFDLGVNVLVLHGLEADVRLPVLRARKGADPSQATLVAAPKTEDDASWDVYITYATHDREVVRQLATELHEQNLRVFFDEWTVAHGTVTSQRLEEGVRSSHHGIVVISPTTMEEPWARQQYAALLDHAVERGRRLIPVVLGEASVDLPPFLKTRRPVRLGDPSAPSYRESIRVITRALRGQPPGPPPRRG